MGVKNLWKILQPSKKTPNNHTLCIDTSFWKHALNQTHNVAYTTTFRILKLLYDNIKPYFVFDGAPVIQKKMQKRRVQQKIQDQKKFVNAVLKKKKCNECGEVFINCVHSKIQVFDDDKVIKRIKNNDYNWGKTRNDYFVYLDEEIKIENEELFSKFQIEKLCKSRQDESKNKIIMSDCTKEFCLIKSDKKEETLMDILATIEEDKQIEEFQKDKDLKKEYIDEIMEENDNLMKEIEKEESMIYDKMGKINNEESVIKNEEKEINNQDSKVNMKINKNTLDINCNKKFNDFIKDNDVEIFKTENEFLKKLLKMRKEIRKKNKIENDNDETFKSKEGNLKTYNDDLTFKSENMDKTVKINDLGNDKFDNTKKLKKTEKKHQSKFIDETTKKHEKTKLADVFKKDDENFILANSISYSDCNTLEIIRQVINSFSLPVVYSVSESDAQCAQMCRDGIVDGVISDDSDLIVYGATLVIKNYFNKNRDCTVYTLDECGFTRNSLIKFACLLGCDYCKAKCGLKKALEIVKNDDEIDELKNVTDIYNSGGFKVNKHFFCKPNWEKVANCLKVFGVEDNKIENLERIFRKIDFKDWN